uniref:Ig-like domain-containing protein n=1 Tax=Haplochromis burtoni TaxID=8153 RepID=A0A3Q3CXZ9_HAPBU
MIEFATRITDFVFGWAALLMRISASTILTEPVVTLHPNWSEIYRGETITVRCEIHGGDTEWDYEWEANSIRKPPNQNEYRIISASSSNSGNYRCKGRMKSSQNKTTEWSDSVTLTVFDSSQFYLHVDTRCGYIQVRGHRKRVSGEHRHGKGTAIYTIH